MRPAASPEDLRRSLQHRRRDAKNSLGKTTAQIQSEAAANGALGNGRLGLLYIEAAGRVWRDLVDTSLNDLREFARATRLPGDELMAVMRDELGVTLPELRVASKFDSAASERFRSSPAALKAYEAEWAKLPPYMDLKLRQFELGIHEQSEAYQPSVTYSIQAHTISGPVQQGTHQSTQTVVVSGDTLFTRMEAAIQNEVTDDRVKDELLELVQELRSSRKTPEFLGAYQRFMSAAANHVTVVAPFLPALAQMLSG